MWSITAQGRSNRGRNPTTYVNNLMIDTNMVRLEELQSLMLDRNTWREKVKYCCRGSGWPGLSKLIYLVFQLWQLWATRYFLYWWKFQIIWTWISWVWEVLALLVLLHSGNPAAQYLIREYFVGDEWRNFGYVRKIFLDNKFSPTKLFPDGYFYPMNISTQQILLTNQISLEKWQNFLIFPHECSI